MVATLRDEGSWMTEEALGQYNEYLRLAEELETARGKRQAVWKSWQIQRQCWKVCKERWKDRPQTASAAVEEAAVQQDRQRFGGEQGGLLRFRETPAPDDTRWHRAARGRAQKTKTAPSTRKS